MMANTVREPARDIPVIAEPDVLVAGGGAAGIAAAVAASQAGASVMLLERWGFLGGTLSAVTLGGFCGVWTVTPERLIPVVGGLFNEFADRLKQRDGITAPRRWMKVASLPYDPTLVKLVSDEMLEARGVDVLFHTWVADVLTEDGRVDSVLLENKGGRFAVRPRVVIDCTGDGDVAARAGAPYELGSGGITQFGSSMFRMANVDMQQFGTLSRDEISQRLETVVNEGTPLPRTMVALYPHPINGVVHLNATKVARNDGRPFDLTDPRELSEAERVGRRQVFLYESVLRKHMPGFKDARVVDIGAQIGIRESRLIRGDHALTADEVLAGVKPEDGIACSAWPVELHGHGLKTVWKFLEDGEYYGIPYRAMTPVGLRNVLVAGRCISATHEAQASVRVSATAFAMGEAAGLASVIALQHGGDVRKVDVRSLQARLRSQGAILELAEKQRESTI
ncbi:MAG TPA: FAD-dependent oxidoreductase [Noviherbaspirillum sp.]|uniref:FAD-dependent oxidoreductase n=1 Tax=Noviherbaspirillum sp. TaxID=1926288 RepID=UPI002B4969B3|nr:FAD-dependent oxidoreductase [Noviherbaspirillum sp.]HJV84685.1 FAD-dependent oxidoreductase [Noviherbaspirillum sp.]